ncbi:hypothetical protein C2E21_2919 [Chlorella sorokiniana]|uniref:Uncharacterized protein n=1 Tax=Chlorella sorokiniana TaxID=3076 RepID=A0A2P6TX22_CHLSO|nr:hypothetical protein C2E21_2919 [Chlorella sorokiniana]|eukprot:PRW58613.1 hypothetical protein C2E21_2919 [Chlorella sorokiniana]
MGAYRQEADEMKDTMRAMRDEQESLKAELATLKAAQQAKQAQQAPAGGDVQGQLLAALLGNSPMGTMLAGMLTGGGPPGKKSATGKRKAPAAGGGAAKKRGMCGGGGAAAAAAATAAEAEAQKRAAALKQKNEPWVVERADGTRGIWPADVSDEELRQMLDEFQEAPLKVGISYTRVAQSATFRHKVLAVPHKKSADGERLYYINRAALIGQAKKRGLEV